jgi:hypothetical protein
LASTHFVIPRQLVPHAVQEAEHTLANGHVGEHVIERVGGAFCHPAAAATRTEGAPFTRKRNQPAEAAVATAKSREPAGEPATLQKVRNCCSTNPRNPSPSRRLAACAKGLEVIVHDLVERTLRGTPRFVARRGRGHLRPAGGRCATDEADDINKKRKKKTSNKDWTNPFDPDAKVTKMKDGRTHLAHKAEHAVDFETGAIVAVTVQGADEGDTTTMSTP